ncbi:MAG: acyl-CoA dehydrogenase family protein [Acidimicrobiales bacterium]
MDFELTRDQLELQRTVRDILDQQCPPAVVRRVVEDGVGADALWSTLVGLDWPALAVPEELGGIGSTWVELAVVIEELGRAVAPTPFLATVTQFVPVVREAGTVEQQKRFVSGAASGQLTGTLAVDEGTGSWLPSEVKARAVRDGGGYRLSGRKRFVVDGAYADEIAVAIRLDGALRVVVVSGSEVDAQPLRPIDATTHHADLALDGVRVEGDRLLGDGDATSALTRAVEEATTAVAVSTVGTCQAIFDLTLDYVKQRQQFGVPVGSFQAVKHKLADMYRDLERARALASFAALCLAEDDPRRAAATAMAKAAAGECQRRVFQDGLQLFGGIGYTWEHDLHLYLRRAKVGELYFGSASQHRRRVAELARAAEG